MNKKASLEMSKLVEYIIGAVILGFALYFILTYLFGFGGTQPDSPLQKVKQTIDVDQIKSGLNLGGGDEDDKKCRKYNSYQACMGLNAKDQKITLTKCFWGKVDGKEDCYSCENEDNFKTYDSCKAYVDVFTTVDHGNVNNGKLVFLSAYKYIKDSEIYKKDRYLCQTNPCGFKQNKASCTFETDPKDPKEQKITSISCS